MCAILLRTIAVTTKVGHQAQREAFQHGLCHVFPKCILTYLYRLHALSLTTRTLGSHYMLFLQRHDKTWPRETSIFRKNANAIEELLGTRLKAGHTSRYEAYKSLKPVPQRQFNCSRKKISFVNFLGYGYFVPGNASREKSHCHQRANQNLLMESSVKSPYKLDWHERKGNVYYYYDGWLSLVGRKERKAHRTHGWPLG